MILDIIFIVAGIALVLWGADRFTDGASGLARKWQVSELIIGLTVVAFGTSLPEFIVSFLSCLRGSGDMSVGNILGSNIFNILVIVGVSSMILALPVSRGVLYRDMPFCLLVTAALVLVGFDGEISRLDASLLFGLFLLFLIYTIYLGKREAAGAETLVEEKKPLWQLFGLILLGIGCLVGGGQILVNGATDVARELGVSEKIIGMTILAAGTSLPELATSVVAARKGSDGLALGNVLGSNVFNAAFVLGACNLIAPMQITGVNMLDWSVLVGSCVLLWIVSFSGRRLTRGEGTLLLTAYVAYMTYTLLH